MTSWNASYSGVKQGRKDEIGQNSGLCKHM
jgi:hypothetical protein